MTDPKLVPVPADHVIHSILPGRDHSVVVETETRTVRASTLRRGMTLVCPGDGRTERITFVRKGGAGRRFVRTSRHDHYLANTRTIEVV